MPKHYGFMNTPRLPAGEFGFWYAPARLREAGISLVEIRNVLRGGDVVFADKLDRPGARWVIIGETSDGERLEVTLIVISELLSVTLERVERVEVRENGDDAA